MKILGIIPARYNSSRFPGKPLTNIAGKSMIQRVYQQAKKCELLSKVIVATDDNRIVSHVNNFKGEVMMKNGVSYRGEITEVNQSYVFLLVDGSENAQGIPVSLISKSVLDDGTLIVENGIIINHIEIQPKGLREFSSNS